MTRCDGSVIWCYDHISFVAHGVTVDYVMPKFIMLLRTSIRPTNELIELIITPRGCRLLILRVCRFACVFACRQRTPTSTFSINDYIAHTPGLFDACSICILHTRHASGHERVIYSYTYTHTHTHTKTIIYDALKCIFLYVYIFIWKLSRTPQSVVYMPQARTFQNYILLKVVT